MDTYLYFGIQERGDGIMVEYDLKPKKSLIILPNGVIAKKLWKNRNKVQML